MDRHPSNRHAFNRHPSNRLVGLWLRVSFVALMVVSAPGASADWPQIFGPGRNSIATTDDEAIWQQTPAIRWQYDCGSGYAGVAIAQGKVFLTHRVDDSEVLDCLDVRDGKRIWRASFPANYKGGYNDDHGPRCVPVIDGQLVFVYGAAGELRAVDVPTGKTLWQRTLRADYGAEDGYFGAASTPIVQQGVVVVAVGATPGAGIVGIDAGTGATLWKATDLEADYASPIAMDDHTVIVPMRMQTVAIASRDGTIRWQMDFGKRGLNVIGATPALIDKHLFLTASYRIGALAIDLSGPQPKTLWKSDEILSSQYNTPLLIDPKHLLGIHGREDGKPGELRCVQWRTSKVMWSEADFGVAHLLGIGNRVIALHTDGTLELLSVTPEAFKSLKKFTLPPGVYRALPAISDGMVYCRSGQGESGKLIALDLRSPSKHQADAQP